MAVHITCPQCKQKVPFGRLFCTFCGAKLELSPDRVTNRLTGDEAFGGIKRWVTRLASFAVVAGAIGVFFWPMPPQGQVGNAAQAASCEQRISVVRSRVLNGIILADAFSEAEVNAELKARIAKIGDASSGAGFMLTDVNVAFRPKIVIVNTRMSLGGKADITYEIEGEPSISQQGFQYEVKSVRIGHVPMPSFLNDFFASRALHVFSEMRTEQDVLGKMKRIDVDQGLFRFTNQVR